MDIQIPAWLLRALAAVRGPAFVAERGQKKNRVEARKGNKSKAVRRRRVRNRIARASRRINRKAA